MSRPHPRRGNEPAPPPEPPETPRSGRTGGAEDAIRAAILAALILGGGAALWRWHEPLWAFFGDPQRLRAWMSEFGPWGPLVSVALNVTQVLLAPVPGQFVGLVNGYLYGLWRGTLYSMIGLLLGTGLAMALGRWFGRPLVERLVNPQQLARWDRIADRRGPPFFFLVFLLPFLPDDVTCFLIGLSPLSIPRMLVLATPARLPGVFVSCWLGARATALPWWAWMPLGGGATALAWLLWRYQAKLERRMVQLIQALVPQDGAGHPE